MNYQKIYSSLIKKAKERDAIKGYKERHHIVPKCLGGSDLETNIVVLTPEEHYLAHQLLLRIYPDNASLTSAALFMCSGKYRNNKLYGWVRRSWATKQAIKMRGKGNPAWGTKWIHNPSLKKSKQVDKNSSLPPGWLEGAKFSWKEKQKKASNEERSKKKKKQELTFWFELYTEYGWEKVRSCGYTFTKQNLVQNLKRYFPEFIPQNGKKRGGRR